MREVERILKRFRDGKIRRSEADDLLNALWIDNTISDAQHDQAAVRLDAIESHLYEAA